MRLILWMVWTRKLTLFHDCYSKEYHQQNEKILHSARHGMFRIQRFENLYSGTGCFRCRRSELMFVPKCWFEIIFIAHSRPIAFYHSAGRINLAQFSLNASLHDYFSDVIFFTEFLSISFFFTFSVSSSKVSLRVIANRVDLWWCRWWYDKWLSQNEPEKYSVVYTVLFYPLVWVHAE